MNTIQRWAVGLTTVSLLALAGCGSSANDQAEATDSQEGSEVADSAVADQAGNTAHSPTPTPAPASHSTPTPAPAPTPGAVPVPDAAVVASVPDFNVSPSDIRYVSATGSDNANGLSEATAWKSIGAAVSQAKAGQLIYVKAGLYIGEQIVFATNGTADKPIQLVGYTRNPGDGHLYSVKATDMPKAMDQSSLPLLDGGNRSEGMAISLRSRSNIVIRNLQIRNYEFGIYGQGTTRTIIDNVSAAELGDLQATYSGKGIVMGTGSNYNQISNSSVFNAGAEAIAMIGDYNKIDASHVFADDNSTEYKSATDYYIIISGNYNTIRGNFVRRLGNLKHGGHGIGAKKDTQYNLFEDNVAINFTGASFYARHRGSQNNTFRRNLASGGGGHGFAARDGATNNRIESHRIENMTSGVSFYDALEDEGQQSAGNYNTFVDLEMINIRGHAIRFNDYIYSETTSRGNRFEGMLIDGASHLFEVAHPSFDTLITDSVIRNVTRYADYETGFTENQLDVQFERTTTENSGFNTQ